MAENESNPRQICKICGKFIELLNDGTSTWWVHDIHPENGHDAEPIMAVYDEPELVPFEVPQVIIDSWYDLQVEVQDGKPFQLEEANPITNMMRELAKISNMCLEHYLRLYVYQQALNESPEVASGPAMTKFLNSLPKS